MVKNVWHLMYLLIKYQTVSLEIVKRFVLQAPTHSFMSGCFIWAAHYFLIT